jgi:hypothetical protein
MLRRALAPAVLLVLAATSVGAARTAHVKSPPWISIESPVNPYEPATRDAAFVVRAWAHGNPVGVADLAGSAEGLVDGKRQSIALRFEPTSQPNAYAVRRQWPAAGAWVVRVTLFRTATAIVSLDRAGTVAGVYVPTRMESGLPLPRAVAAAEIDSTLAVVAARR